MVFYSTRNINIERKSKEAIIEGLSKIDGGLFCPKYEDICAKSFDIKDLINNDYLDNTKLIFKIFFDDFTDAEIDKCINNAYNEKNFNMINEKAYGLSKRKTIAPLSNIGDDYLLELYHGPTSAFKDMALTILPHLITTAYKDNNSKIYILTATSGDTGKAALSGFKDVENIMITVFFPTDGVSNIQKLQMQTSEGNNVDVCAINGNFDDCQRLVKEIYTDLEIKKICNEHHIILSSANSINIGRLVPQIIYYINSYIDLVNANVIKIYDKVNFIVPTGNFGDILAGFIAKLLGLPINKLICASNENNVLTDFINTGIYNKNRELHKTISPSMDILVSSNLERLLFLLSDNDADLINTYMNDLNKNGKYKVSDTILNKIKTHFIAYYTDENNCRKTIKDTFTTDKRLIDTHTAIAYNCLMKYKNDYPDDKSKNIILSTASPYKFAKDVLLSIDEKTPLCDDNFSYIHKLNEISNEKIPTNLSKLKLKAIRFNKTMSYDEAKNSIINNINNGDIL